MFSAASIGIRAVEPVSAIILGIAWRIMTSPDRLEGGAEAQIDHDERIIWMGRDLSQRRRSDVLATALNRAAREAVDSLPSTE